MTNFIPALGRLRRLVLLQRALRLGLRAVWTGLSGLLIFWGLDAAFGWFPNRWVWISAGLVLALPSLAALLRPVRLGRLAFRMDRLLGLQEQMTTALAIARRGTEANPVEAGLLEDAGGLVPGIRGRITARGWFLTRDLEALAVVAVLVAAIGLSTRTGVPFPIPARDPSGLPAFDQPPGFRDIFPSGIPGLTEGAPGDPGNPAGAPDGSTAEGLGQLDNILYDLGEALSEHPETADAGEALQNGDLEGAAAAIERTADSVDLLPEDARQNLQQALEQAAEQARDAGQEDLAADLEAAAQALNNPDPNSPLAADALDELAEGLRELGEAFAALGRPGEADSLSPPENAPQVGSAGGSGGAGSGAGGQSPPEPITRLEGEGEDFRLEGDDTPSGLLQPGSNPGSPATGAGGSPTVTAGDSGPGTAASNSVLTPYSFPWDWRDVVSDYFSP